MPELIHIRVEAQQRCRKYAKVRQWCIYKTYARAHNQGVVKEDLKVLHSELQIMWGNWLCVTTRSMRVGV